MLHVSRARLTVATALAVTFAGASASQAAPIQLFSAAELSPTDVLYQYPARTTAGTQPVVPSPFVLTGPDNVLTFTEAGSAFVRMDQEPSTPPAGGWFGTFAAGTRLLYTGNNVDADWFGPITISFGAPIFEFGLLAQFSDEFFAGPFFFTVFNGPTTLATFSRGVSPLPSFLGARAADDIFFTSILVRGPSFAPGDNDFAIGPVIAQVPEPATLVLVGSGVVGFLVRRKVTSGRAAAETVTAITRLRSFIRS
jgi:PEP-CTERM motif